MIDIGKFIDLYTAKYGKFPADPKSETQVNEWKRVLVQVPESKLGEMFSIVSEQLGKSNKNPRTREFEIALRRLEVPEDRPRGFVGEGCGICYGSGILTIWVTYLPDDHRRIGFHRGGYPYEIGVPCKCSKGIHLRHKHYPKIKDADQERAFQWCVEQKEIAKAEGATPLGYLHNMAKRYIKLATFQRRGRGMEWLKEMKGGEDVVRDSG